MYVRSQTAIWLLLGELLLLRFILLVMERMVFEWGSYQTRWPPANQSSADIMGKLLRLSLPWDAAEKLEDEEDTLMFNDERCIV